jgi:hypothetical protein
MLEPPTPEIKSILLKMGAGFDLAYKRFLDLQKAEAQAREAQIEAALEKVRSRSLAMHKSDELKDVVTIVFQKLQELDNVFDGVNIVIFPEGTKDHIYWTASDLLTSPTSVHFPYIDHPGFTMFAEAREKGIDFFAKVFSYEDKKSYYKYAFEHTDFKNVPNDSKNYVLESKCIGVSFALSKNSAISTPSFTGELLSEKKGEVLKRFAGVFDQAYTRFLDLQKAEAQAREAQIELGLERVRAKAMAMQSSSELAELVDTLFRELTKLDLLLDRCLIMLYDPATNDSTWWIAAPESDALPIGVFVKYHEYAPYLAYIDAWHKRILKWRYVLEGTTKKNGTILFFQKLKWLCCQKP